MSRSEALDMAGDTLLQKLCHDRQPRRQATAVGDLVRQFGEAATTRVSVMRRLNEVVESIIAAPFARHCRLEDFGRGMLTIGVDDPALVPELRQRYLFLLRESLARELPDIGPVDIRFRATGLLGSRENGK